jgi:hypothetical protein
MVPTQCTIKTMQTGAVVLEYVRLCCNSEKLSHWIIIIIIKKINIYQTFQYVMHAMLGDVYKYTQTVNFTQHSIDHSINQSIWVASNLAIQWEWWVPKGGYGCNYSPHYGDKAVVREVYT